MTKTKWLHFGLIGSALAGFAALAACSSNDIVDPGVDASVEQDSGNVDPPDTGTVDSGTDAGKPVFPKVTLVHAAMSVGPVKLCLAAKQTGVPDPKTEIFPTKVLPANPNSPPALPEGAPVVLPFKSIDASGYNLIAILIKPQAFVRISTLKGAAPECGDFMKDAVLEPTATNTPNDGAVPVENKDFFLVANVTPGTFAQGKSYVAALTGCPKGFDLAQSVKCGPNYDTAKGNIRIVPYEIDTKTTAGKNGVQFFHLSQEADPVLSLGGTVDGSVKAFITAVPNGSDAGGVDAGDGREYLNTTGVTFANTVASGKGTPAPAFVPSAALTLASKFGLTGSAGGNDLTNQTTAFWAAAATGKPPAADFVKAGSNYIFAAVGDPSQPPTITLGDGGTAVNYKTFRILMLEADPVVGDPSSF